MDGLGGYADAEHDTELEEADDPEPRRARGAEGITGLVEPVGPGITPGSGPGHLALFGYDPEVFELGRGALSAAGLEFDLLPGDVAARGNFATLAPDGTILDRRAGPDPGRGGVGDRPSACSEGAQLGDGVEVFFVPEREHRVLVVLRGEGLDPRITDTDPQKAGVAPLESDAHRPAGEAHGRARQRALRSRARAAPRRAKGERNVAPRLRLPPRAAVVRRALRAARRRRRDLPDVPRDREHPRDGRARRGRRISTSRSRSLREAWNDYDYFFVHHKYTDSAGEDGDRPRKIDGDRAARPRGAGAARPRAGRDRRLRGPRDADPDGRALMASGADAALVDAPDSATRSTGSASGGAHAAPSASGPRRR